MNCRYLVGSAIAAASMSAHADRFVDYEYTSGMPLTQAATIIAACVFFGAVAYGLAKKIGRYTESGEALISIVAAALFGIPFSVYLVRSAPEYTRTSMPEAIAVCLICYGFAWVGYKWAIHSGKHTQEAAMFIGSLWGVSIGAAVSSLVIG
jgi:hypothetical protein